MADEAKPMEEAPAEPTDAQKQQGAAGGIGASPVVELTDEQKEVAKADAEAIAENPNEVHVREANPIMGGENFEYGQAPKSE